MKMVPVQVLLPDAFFIRDPSLKYHMFDGEGVVGPSDKYLKVTDGKVCCGPYAGDRKWVKISELKDAYEQYMLKQKYDSQLQSQVKSSDPRAHDQEQYDPEQYLRDRIKEAIREYNDAGYEEVATVLFSYK